MLTPVERYRQALEFGPVEEFSTVTLDPVAQSVGVSAWAAVILGCGGTRPRPAFGGLGYGLSDEEALVGAYGELTEESRSWLAVSKRSPRRASYADLVRQRGADRVQDPRTLGLPAGIAFAVDRPLQWMPMYRERDGAEVLVPAEFVASSPTDLPAAPPPGGWLTTPVTNGLGAGFSRDDALAHALLEVLQRDGNGLTFRALDQGVVVDLDGVSDPLTLSLLDRLQHAGVDVIVKLAATDFGITNLYVVGAASDDDVLAATACGEAAHPDRERALRKAVLEFVAARPRKLLQHGSLDPVAEITPTGYLDRVLPDVYPDREEPRVLNAMLTWLRSEPEAWRPRFQEAILSRRTSVRFSELPTAFTREANEPKRVTSLLLGRLRAEGFDVLVADLDDGSKSVGRHAVHTVKVVVPGLEVETVAYGRIGERNVTRLLAAGRDDLVSVGSSRPGAARVHLTVAAEERLGGPAWLDLAALEHTAGALYPLYREPGSHSAQLALRRTN